MIRKDGRREARRVSAGKQRPSLTRRASSRQAFARKTSGLDWFVVLWIIVVIAVPLSAQPPRDTLPLLSLTAIPFGLGPKRQVPPDNPLTDAKVLLGRRLFFDPILSADGS